MRWSTSWLVIKDIALTGTGIFVILSQVYAGHPSDVLLAVGATLCAPAIADHARALLSAPTAAPHSPSPGSHAASPPPSAQPEVTGE